MKKALSAFYNNNEFKSITRIDDCVIFFTRGQNLNFLKEESKNKYNITMDDLLDEYKEVRSDMPFKKIIWLSEIISNNKVGYLVYFLEERAIEDFITCGYMLIDNKSFMFEEQKSLKIIRDDIGLTSKILNIQIEMARKNKGIGKCKADIPIKNEKGKNKKKEVNYYYLATDKKDKIEYTKSGLKIEYSHSFLVAGHWRKLPENSLGKDREGIRNVENYTWITGYIKGNLDKPLVNSVRIVN